jgi:hypothetical protein
MKEFSISDGKGHSIEWNEILRGDKLVLFFSEGSCEDWGHFGNTDILEHG